MRLTAHLAKLSIFLSLFIPVHRDDTRDRVTRVNDAEKQREKVQN